MKFRYWVAILCALILCNLTCDIDKGLDITPWIEGKIIIDSILRVNEGQTGDMIVVVAPDFPPKKWTDIIKTPPLHFDRDVNKDTTEFKVPLNFGTYAVIAVLWKPKGEEWSFETIDNILGVYTDPNIFEPKPVTITKNDKFVRLKEYIYADFSFIRYGAFIKGKIKISPNSQFNPETAMMIIASFPKKPETVKDYLFALGWDLGLPVTENKYQPSCPFILDVWPGYHKYIGLFWKGKKGAPYDFKKIAEFVIPNIDPPIIIGEHRYEGIRIDRGETLEYYTQGDSTVWIELIADFTRTYQ